MEILQNKTQKFIIKFLLKSWSKVHRQKQMIGQLYANVRELLALVSEDIIIRKFSDKIEVVAPIENVDETRTILLQTPGIEQVLEALQFDDMTTLDAIKVKVNEMMAGEIQDKTFVIRAKRTGVHEFISPQIEQTVGGYMLDQNITSTVDLHNPQVTLYIELIYNQLNIITQKYQGLGGYPLGTQGDILSLMSGGFDSTVASYLTMKRGIKTHFIFLILAGLLMR